MIFKDGSRLVDELAVANAHPNGSRPFGREEYTKKFRNLTNGIITTNEADRFLATVQDLPAIPACGLHALNVMVPQETLAKGKSGIFS